MNFIRLLLKIPVALAISPCIIQYSEHSGAIASLKTKTSSSVTGFTDLWISLSMSKKRAGLRSILIPVSHSAETPKSEVATNTPSELSPNPLWRASRNTYPFEGITETGGKFGPVDTQRLENTGIAAQSSMLFDVHGYIGLGPSSSLAKEGPFRLVRHPEELNWMSLHPGSGDASAVSKEFSVKIDPEPSVWSMRVSGDLGG